jgi:hypothetical protein
MPGKNLFFDENLQKTETNAAVSERLCIGRMWGHVFSVIIAVYKNDDLLYDALMFKGRNFRRL